MFRAEHYNKFEKMGLAQNEREEEETAFLADV